MKQLSVEEKAKAYDEAIEKLRSLYDNYDTVSTLIDVKEELGHIFPELKENEDERTKNEIIAFVEQSIHRGGGTPIPEEQEAKWIAWLEKQGEQKPVDFSVLRIWKYIVDAVWTEKEGIGQYLDSPFTEEVAKKLQKRFGNIEQILANSVKTFKDKPNLAPYFYCSIGGTIPKCSDCKRNHLNSKYETKEIKTWMTPESRGTKQCSDYIKQNYYWSGKYIADVFEKVGLTKIVREQSNDNLTNALQNAMIELSKFTPRSKPAWSEGDEVSYSETIAIIESWVKGRENDGFRYKDAEIGKQSIDWLKSLKERYTWKPSDVESATENFGCWCDKGCVIM